MEKDTLTLEGYVAGYALSLLLTLLIFGLTYIHLYSDHETISHPVLHAAIAVTAILQLAVQAIFFLHLSRRNEQRANLLTFIFTLFVVTIIAGGSLWIMNNLNNNMSPEQVVKYMHNED